MRARRQALLGRHDFAAFQSVGGDVHTSERTIRSTDRRRSKPPAGLGYEQKFVGHW